MMRSVYRAQARMNRDCDLMRKGYEAELAVYEAELAAYKKARAAAVKNGEDPPDPPRKPKPPPVRQLFTADTTREAFADLLFDNPRGVGLFRDELSGFALSLNQYRAGGRGDDRQFWLSLWSGEACPTNRKGKRTWLPDPFACICGCIQPDVLPKLQPESGVEDGFVARFLFAWPEPVRPSWTGLEPSAEVVAAYEEMFDRLLALPLHTDEAGEAQPAVLHLTPDALRRFAAFVDELADDLGGDELPDTLKAAWGKFAGYTARLALVLYVCRMACGEADPAAPAVDLAAVEAAIALVRYFQAHARRVYLRLGSAAAVAGEKDVHRVIGWIDRNRDRWARRTPPHFTWREAFHDLHNTYWDRPDDLEAALRTLEDRGHIRDITPDPKPRGRKPKGVYEIHPKTGAHNAQNARNDPPPSAPDSGSPDSGHFEHCEHRSGGGNGVVSGPAAPPRLEPDPAPPSPATVGPSFEYVTDPADLPKVATAIGESSLVGLDTETTGLNPRADKVRLLSLCCETTDGGTCTYVVDCFAADPSPLWSALAAVPVVGHNLLFDLQFLARLGFEPGECRDTMLMSQVLYTGDRTAKHSLAACCERELGETASKIEQASDWSAALTPGQLRYAAADAELARRLHDALAAKLAAANLTDAAAIENRALPAVAWLAAAGVGFDRAAWQALADGARAEAERLAGELDRAAPPRSQGEMFGSGWKWDSPQHVAEALRAVGHAVEGTDDDTLAAIDHPLAALLRDYRAARKLATTYGPAWLKNSCRDGRVYAGWRQLGANSGRMACAAPNLQNLPREARYRRCFVAPLGRALIKADYSQIELRIAAKVAGEAGMIEAYRRGDDLHTLTARAVLGKEDVSKADRQLAKAVNFGLLYGMGARGFRLYARSNYGVELTETQAERYRRAFFAAYPALRRWHTKVGGTQGRPVETRTLAGRRCLKVERFTEKLNLGVQGTGADGLKAALALLWERRAECPGGGAGARGP
jgi:DNA polymerase-1